MLVTSLSLSMDGSILLSGSKDCTARVWDVNSRQCLKVLEHKGTTRLVYGFACTARNAKQGVFVHRKKHS